MCGQAVGVSICVSIKSGVRISRCTSFKRQKRFTQNIKKKQPQHDGQMQVESGHENRPENGVLELSYLWRPSLMPLKNRGWRRPSHSLTIIYESCEK